MRTFDISEYYHCLADLLVPLPRTKEIEIGLDDDVLGIAGDLSR